MELALLLPATLGGLALTFLLPLPLPLLPRLAAAFCAGSAVLGLAALVLASLFGLGALTLAASAAVAALPAAFLVRPSTRQRALAAVDEARAWRPDRRRLATAVLFVYVLALGGLVWRVFDRACFRDVQGLQTSNGHNIGDLPFHLAVVQGFARGQNFPPEHPELSGVRLTYPFLVDLVTALAVRAGAAPVRALLVHNLALALALLALAYHMARRWTGDALAALIAPLLVFFSGGLGFLLLARDVDPTQGGLWALLWRLPADYTMRVEAGLRWGNALTTLLVTQRSFLMGLPLFMLAATLWWDAVSSSDDDRGRRRAALLAAGVVVGLMPLVHGHSFAASMAIAAALAVLFPARAWAGFFGAALLLGVPQVIWMATGSALETSRFLAVHLGWDRDGRNPLWFWLWNTGVFLPLLAVALLWRGGGAIVSPRLARFYVPFLGCFVVPNLFRLSPWIWDNIKFLFLWWVASAPLVALALARLLRGGALARAGGVALLVIATLAGALDVWRVAQPARTYVIFPPAALEVADQVAAATPPGALILRAPTYDSPILLTGRRSLMGYDGHIWSQGLDKDRRPELIARTYRGGERAEELLRELAIDYVFLGAQERRAYEVDEAFLARFPLAVEGGIYRLYRVR